MVQIKPIGIKLRDGASRYNDADRIPEFNDIKRKEEGLAKGGREAIVWRRGEAEQVDLVYRRSDYDRTGACSTARGNV